ncbi:nuclear pore complex protein NUP1-like isoform X2 [Actinidia eriantha]|uniref:nuclear pore complex protein NUP1-like isoform X2 n=1 Tax=Actinidia eriantha TaxID=165200 RepID=UPI0025861EED|nr:nuclear pore complex protein NUP1-like isoform X2 [Actinidia eriantha]
MASTTASEGTAYEGGGGKLRKGSYRRHQTTPYDRPPTTNPRGNRWLPKFVDPASKLVFATSRMFLSSVFLQKRLPPPSPPLPPEANQESRNKLREAGSNNPPGVQGPVTDGGGNPTKSLDESGITNLEQILKQKRLTRSEVDRLTELLQSKTADIPNGNEGKRNEQNFPQPVSPFGIQHEFASSPMQDNGMQSNLENNRFHGYLRTPVVSSQVLEKDVASPAELAKAYMSSTSKVPPSMLGMHSQALREDANLLDNIPFPLKSAVMSAVSKPAVRVGIPENGFLIPSSRGRSAIYYMARTPYSRVNPTAAQKGIVSAHDVYGGPSASSSQHAWELNGQHGSGQLALKRTSSVLEDDFGSVTPYEARVRVRDTAKIQKVGYGYGCGMKRFCLDEPKHRTSKTVGESGDNSKPNTNYSPVPYKSTEMATRILQQLEMLAPKEKSSEGKLVTAREKSASRLTPSMLRGQALRSLVNVDSSRILQHDLEDLNNTRLPDARDTTSEKQNKVEENGSKKFVVSHYIWAPAVVSDTTDSVKDTVPDVNTESSIKPHLTQSQKKWAFHMSAHEFLELDDGIHFTEPTSTPLAEEKEKLETSMEESKAASTVVLVNKTLTSSAIKPPGGLAVKKSTHFKTSDASVADGKNTSFTFPTAPASSAPFQTVVACLQSTSAVDKIVPLKEPKAPSPISSSSSNDVNKVPLLTFSSSPSVSEFLALKSSAPSESKPESSISLTNIASGATDAVPAILDSDKGDDKNTQKSGELMGKPEISSSMAASTPISASSIFSFGAPVANNSSLSNGSLTSCPFVFSSPAPVLASGDSTNQTFTNSVTSIASSTSATMATNDTTTSSASNSSVSNSSPAPSFPAAPIFKFGSTSAALSNSVSTVPSTSSAETTDLKAKTDKETIFGNLSSSPLGGKTFEMASAGSSIFGFSASVNSSSANNLFQGSLFGISSESSVSTQASSAGSAVATVTQSVPIQFGSSSSSPVFGTSASTSFSGSSLFGSSSSSSLFVSSTTSSSSLFGSSTLSSSRFGSSTPASVFDSGTGFGLTSSASSSQTNSISSSGTPTTSLLGPSWPPTTFSSASQSSGFVFGASSASLTTVNNGPVFGSSTNASSGSIFSFTSATASSSQAQPVFGSSVPAFTPDLGNGDQMSMEDSMAEDSVQSSSPAVPVFGQLPILAAPSDFVFGSTVPPGRPTFQFGGQQNQNTPQIQSPFQLSGSIEFGAGSSFSLGSGGGDKSSRKIVKVKHKNRRR